MGRVGCGYHPDRVAHARVTCGAIHGRKAWKLGDAFSSRFAGVLSRYAPHQSRYFLTRLWAVHSSHTRVLKWFFLGSNTQSRCVEAHQDARRYGGPTRPSSCRMLGSSPDTRTPAGGDASRAFPARRRRRRTERTPKFAILPSGAVCVALAGALACSGVARVHAALPNGSYEIHAAIDAAYPEGASTSMKSNPPSPRSPPQPRQNNHNASETTNFGTKIQTLTILPPVLLHLHPRRRRHRLIIPVPTPAQRDMPHHPVLRARRREGHPWWTRR